MKLITVPRRVQRQGRAKLRRQRQPLGPPEGLAPLSNQDFSNRRALRQEMPLASTSKAWKPGAPTVPQERVADDGAPVAHMSATSSETVAAVSALLRT
jgi:hypothetical protein